MSEQESLINSEQEVKDEVGEVAERPEWLPEKFFKDGTPDYEGLAKSYTEAESYIGKKKEDLTEEIKVQLQEEQIKNVPEAPDKYNLPEIPEQYNTESLWVNKNFNEAQRPALEMLCSSSSGVETVERIMSMMQQSMSQAPDSTISVGKTRQDLEEMMKDRRYWHPTNRDENYVKQIDSAFDKLYKWFVKNVFLFDHQQKKMLCH